MKIQFALTEYLPDVFGGAEVYTRNLAATLANRGHDVSILSPGIVRKNSRVNDDLYEDIPVHRFAFFPERVSSPFYAIRYYPSLYDEALEWFTQTKPDVVHITNSWFMAPVVFAAAACDIPIVGTHVDFVWTCKESHLLDTELNFCAAWNAQKCKKCFPDLTGDEWKWVQPLRDEMHALLAQAYAFHHCPCPLLADQIRMFGAGAENVGVWPYGVPDELPACRREKTESCVLRLAYIGRWNRIKGIDVLLDAMAMMVDRNDIELTLYGEREAWNQDCYGAEMKKKADALSAVRIGGRFDPSDLAEVHQSIDAIVTPSIWPENSPVSILEALALGTAVICADGAGMTNLITHGENGLLFENRNAASLAQQIQEMADGPKLKAISLGVISDDADRFEKIYADAQPAPKCVVEDFNNRMRTLIDPVALPGA